LRLADGAPLLFDQFLIEREQGMISVDETSRVDSAIVVTGASRGIGAAVARALASQGQPVAVNFARDEDGALAVVESIAADGGVARAYQGDVSIEADVMRLFRDVDRDFGRPSGLVNNAGITGGFERVETVTSELLSGVFAINVIGAFLCCREAVKRMSFRHGGKGGSIVNISSRAAQLGGSGEWVHYAASKGAIDSLTIGLAREVAGEGIRVNAVSPGLIGTGIHAAAGDPGRANRLAGTIPLGREGTAEDVAAAVTWLMSPAAAYITGAIVPVSGGR
jgi:NAD(P)-dependent dehydrogenase (short-subunit alcohol dehydrogenase family)